MTLNDARKNWKLTSAGLAVIVIVLLLLWPKLRQALGDMIFGSPIISVPAPGSVAYPDLNVTINVPQTLPGETSGSVCGCESHGSELYDETMAYFFNGMRQINDDYNAAIMASVPTWAVQYWNNAAGYRLSQTAGHIFGG